MGGFLGFHSLWWKGLGHSYCQIFRSSWSFGVVQPRHGRQRIQNQNWSVIKTMLLDYTSKYNKRQPNGEKICPWYINIANIRIYIEQDILRLQEFRILKHQLSLLYLPILNDIVWVISGLVNLKRPLAD